MSSADSRPYFDSLAGEWAGKYLRSRSFKERRAIILSLLDAERVARGLALDYGCGAGVLTRDLASRFDSVVATDQSPAMLDAARATVAGCGNVAVATSAEFEGRRFDFILCSAVIEYVPEDVDFLRGLGALLAPRGKLLVTFPRRWGPVQVFSRCVLKHAQSNGYARHQVHTYTEAMIRQTAASAGLRCLRLVRGVRVWPLLPARAGEQILAVMSGS